MVRVAVSVDTWRTACHAKGKWNVEHDDGSFDDGDAWHGDAGHGHAGHGYCTHDAGGQLDDGTAVHGQNGEVLRRHENHMYGRGQSGLRHDAEPVHDAGRRHVQLLCHDERHDGLLLQPDDGDVQVRHDERRRHDYV